MCRMNAVAIFLTVFCLSGAASAFDASIYTNKVEMDIASQYTVYWTVNSADQSIQCAMRLLAPSSLTCALSQIRNFRYYNGLARIRCAFLRRGLA